jgi:zinc transporter ZupT
MIYLIAILVFVATGLGGLFALRFRDKLHLITGFSAGAVIGVAFFDLLPEAIELAGESVELHVVTALIALGFVILMILDRFLSLHAHDTHDHEHCENKGHKKVLGGSSFSTHSFLDGLAVGLALQVSFAVGSVVAIAVLAHDFSDGLNTVNVILKNGGTRREALRWLFVDAFAPVLGIIVSLFITVTESTLGLLLALFCGFFLYLGASDLLPESHHAHPTYWTTIMTIVGIVCMYVIISFAHA